MKIHKYEIFVLDFQDFGHQEFYDIFNNLDFIGQVYYSGSGNIKKWSDEHELNKSSSNKKTWQSYINDKTK